MVLTDDWKKGVCALVREADVGNLGQFDDVLGSYENDCEQICNYIETMAAEWDDVDYEGVYTACVDVLGSWRPSYKQLNDLIDSICSLIGIPY